jgi:hypothetical protein
MTMKQVANTIAHTYMPTCVFLDAMDGPKDSVVYMIKDSLAFGTLGY